MDDNDSVLIPEEFVCPEHSETLDEREKIMSKMDNYLHIHLELSAKCNICGDTYNIKKTKDDSYDIQIDDGMSPNERFLSYMKKNKKEHPKINYYHTKSEIIWALKAINEEERKIKELYHKCLNKYLIEDVILNVMEYIDISLEAENSIFQKI